MAVADKNDDKRYETITNEMMTMLAEAPRLHLRGGGYVAIDKEAFEQLINSLIVTLPKDIQTARVVSSDRKKIYEDANREAESIIAAARARAQELIEQNEIVKGAQQRAIEITEAAEDRADQIVKDARRHAAQIETTADNFRIEVITKGDNYFLAKLEELSGVLANIRNFADNELLVTNGLTRQVNDNLTALREEAASKKRAKNAPADAPASGAEVEEVE